MKKIGYFVLLLVIVGILSGCATTAKVTDIITLTPEKIKGLTISSLTLEVLDNTPGQKNQKLAEILKESLKTEFSKNEIPIADTAENTLRVSMEKIYHVNFLARTLFGFFAGQSTLETDVSLLDKERITLTEFKVSSNAGFKSAIFELDAMERISKKSAEEIVNRLKSLRISVEKPANLQETPAEEKK